MLVLPQWRKKFPEKDVFIRHRKIVRNLRSFLSASIEVESSHEGQVRKGKGKQNDRRTYQREEKLDQRRRAYRLREEEKAQRDDQNQNGQEEEPIINAGQSLEGEKHGKQDGVFWLLIFQVPMEVEKRQRNQPRAQKLNMSHVIQHMGVKGKNDPAGDRRKITPNKEADEKKHSKSI
jgi:hypothetical protein